MNILYRDTPILRSFEPTSSLEATQKAIACAERLLGDGSEVKATTIAHHIAVSEVFCQKERLEKESFWLVGGRLPYLLVSQKLVETPVEALVVYALNLQCWVDQKGRSPEVPGISDFVVPPRWEKLSPETGFEEWRVGELKNIIAWNLIPNNASAVQDPELREFCTRFGWIAQQVERSAAKQTRKKEK